MKIYNVTKNTVVAQHTELARSFIKRFFGLMGRKILPEGHAMVITPCNSIHMLFMRFPIDAVFIDKNGVVLHLVENIKPWRVSRIIGDARSVIELPVGSIRKSSSQIGDTLEIV